MATIDIDGEIVKKKKKKSAFADIPTAEQDRPVIRQETERIARGISQRAKAKQAQLDQPFAGSGFQSISQERIRGEREFEAAQDIQDVEGDIAKEFRQARRGEQREVRAAGRGEELQVSAENRERLRNLEDLARTQRNQLGFVDPALQQEIDQLRESVGQEPAGAGPVAGAPQAPGAPLTIAQQLAASNFHLQQQTSAAELGGIFVPGEGFTGEFQVVDPEGNLVTVDSLGDLQDIQDLGFAAWQELSSAFSDPFISGNQTAVDIASDIETFGINKLEFVNILQRHAGEDTATLKASVRDELTGFINDLTSALPSATEEDIKFKNKERRRLALAIGQVITKLRGEEGGTTGADGAAGAEDQLDEFEVSSGVPGNPAGFEAESTTFGDLELLVQQGDLIDEAGGLDDLRQNWAASVNSEVRRVSYLGDGLYELRIRTAQTDKIIQIQMA